LSINGCSVNSDCAYGLKAAEEKTFPDTNTLRKKRRLLSSLLVFAAIQDRASAIKLSTDLCDRDIHDASGNDVAEKQALRDVCSLRIQRPTAVSVQYCACTSELPSDLRGVHIDGSGSDQTVEKQAARHAHALGEQSLVQLTVLKAQEVETGLLKPGCFREAAEVQRGPAERSAERKVKGALDPAAVECDTAFVHAAVLAATCDQETEEVGADARLVGGGGGAARVVVVAQPARATILHGLDQLLFRRGGEKFSFKRTKFSDGFEGHACTPEYTGSVEISALWRKGLSRAWVAVGP
jgi:hypothetical protein